MSLPEISIELKVVLSISLPLLILMVYEFVDGLRSFRLARRLHRYGEITSGYIYRAGFGKSTHYRITYTVNGSDYTIKSIWMTARMSATSHTTVLYDPEDPRKACIENHDLTGSTIRFTTSAVILAVALIFEFICIVYAL
ncbi:MAG: hypothetical protein IJK31_06075 [Ruminococcus sp.]|nr:hypothetical protein [Ruminococcus sp.]